MPVVFDTVTASVVEETPPTTTTTTPAPDAPPPVPLKTQLRKLDQRTRRLVAN